MMAADNNPSAGTPHTTTIPNIALWIQLQSLLLTASNSSMRLILRDFPFVPREHLRHLLRQHNDLLLPTYLALETIIYKWGDIEWKPWPMDFDHEDIPPLSAGHLLESGAMIARFQTHAQTKIRSLLQELQASRTIRLSRDRKRSMDKEKEEEEKRIHREAEENGEVSECQCCFDEHLTHRMVHCNGEHEHVSLPKASAAISS